MPDEWEKANGLNPNDPSDANKDCTGDGYTNIEKYINGISTRNCICLLYTSNIPGFN